MDLLPVKSVAFVRQNFRALGAISMMLADASGDASEAPFRQSVHHTPRIKILLRSFWRRPVKREETQRSGEPWRSLDPKS